MTTADALTGRCLCGTCTVTIKAPAPTIEQGIHVCHCLDCRRNTGGLASYFLMPSEEQLEISGTPKSFQHQGTGSRVTRYFCGDCGTPLYGIVGRFPGIRFVHSGTFPPGSLPAPHTEIWLQNAEKWEKPYPNLAFALDTQPPIESK